MTKGTVNTPEIACGDWLLANISMNSWAVSATFLTRTLQSSPQPQAISAAPKACARRGLQVPPFCRHRLEWLVEPVSKILASDRGPLFVIFSGLPASGKTTLARSLAAHIGLPLLDKDDILEQLFDQHRNIDEALRSQLSRQSDRELQAIAERSWGAVLVSFWQNPTQPGTSGTPSDWLRMLPGSVIEVHCKCSPELAQRQFKLRSRHPGHNDVQRLKTFLPTFDQISTRYPLDVGPLLEVEVRSTDPIQLASRICLLWDQATGA